MNKNIPSLFSIDKHQSTPVYRQLVDTLILGIEKKRIKEGDPLPSINQLSKEQNLAKETIVKAFRILQERGIIRPVRGKGFFIASTDIHKKHRIFLLFDTFSAYKEVLYHSIKKQFGEDAFLDIYFHHYNIIVARKLIDEARGNYTSYIVMPFDHTEFDNTIHLLSPKVYILDRKPDILKHEAPGVYQDFYSDIFNSLSGIAGQLRHYNRLTLVFRNTITKVPDELKSGFEAFTRDFRINSRILYSHRGLKPEKGETFIVIDDEDLVYIVEEAQKRNLVLGKDLGVISYNETPLKKIVAGGVSVISTDFKAMGRLIGEMIISGEPKTIKNNCRFIDRKSV